MQVTPLAQAMPRRRNRMMMVMLKILTKDDAESVESDGSNLEEQQVLMIICLYCFVLNLSNGLYTYSHQ